MKIDGDDRYDKIRLIPWDGSGAEREPKAGAPTHATLPLAISGAAFVGPWLCCSITFSNPLVA